MRGRRRVVDARYLSPRSRRQRRRRSASRTGSTSWPSTIWSRLGGAPSRVRDRRLRQDRHRCLHLAARERRRSRRHPLGTRPRDPWMLNRAVVQPDPVVFLGTAADIMEAAAAAASAGRRVLPVGGRWRDAAHRPVRDSRPWQKCQRSPSWELERLRTIDRVVRLGHLRHVRPRPVGARRGRGPPSPRTLWSCTAPRSGLQYPPLVPIWGRQAITLQPIRIGIRLLRCRSGRVRRGDARGRRRKEPALPACAVLQHTGRLGAPAGARQSGVVLHRVSRTSGTGRTGSRSTQDASHRNWPAPPPSPPPGSVFAQHVGPGMARLAQLAEMAY